jgi:hypothetical protein
MDLLISYNKLLMEFLNNTILFYSIKKDISIFTYKIDKRSKQDYLEGNTILNLKRIIGNYDKALKKLKNDSYNLDNFKESYLRQNNTKMPLTKLVGSRVNTSVEYNEYVNISKKYMTIEKRLFLLLKKINGYQSEITIYKDVIHTKIKPFLCSIKKIQRNWRACRYNPDYKMCQTIFFKYLPKEALLI